MSNILKLSSAQRMAMVSSGLNPLNEAHVQKFLSGKVSVTDKNENMNRIKEIYLNGIGSQGLGGGDFSEAQYSKAYQGGPIDEMPETPVQQQRGNRPAQDVKAMIAADMEDYGTSTGNMSSSGLLSLRESPAPRQQQQQGNKTQVAEVAANGDRFATAYFNAFVRSLREPSTKANMEVYKSLKAMLEYEVKLKERTSLLEAYRTSVNNVTKKMYQNLKG